MSSTQLVALEQLRSFQVILSAALILIIAFGLVESRQWLRRNPRAGTLVGYAILVLAFLLYRASPANPDARLLLSSGLLGLAISLIASIILSDPPVKHQPIPTDDIEEKVHRRMLEFKDRVIAIRAAKMAPRHRQLKLDNIAEEFDKFLDAVDRIRARRESE